MSINSQYLFIIYILLTTVCSKSIGQEDLYDIDHTKAFADFLYQTKQYDLAAREYERLQILSPQKETPLRLFKSYRLAELYDIGLKRMDDLYDNIDSVSFHVYLERSRMQLRDNRFDHIYIELPSLVNLTVADKRIISGIADVHQFNKSRTHLKVKEGHSSEYTKASFQNIEPILDDYYTEKWKKPWVAGSLSAIVPGTGRLYAGDWKNAIVSLVFVGLNGYQSYRGFSRNGITSPSGWIFGAIGFGFYIGNIYGSAWTAKRKNEQKKEEYQRRIDSIYFAP